MLVKVVNEHVKGGFLNLYQFMVNNFLSSFIQLTCRIPSSHMQAENSEDLGQLASQKPDDQDHHSTVFKTGYR